MSVTHLLSPADILWKCFEKYGFDAEAIFRSEGLTGEMILKPGERISHAKVEKLWEQATGLIKDPCFGLRAATFWHPSHFNALGFAWLASSTLREAFYRASRYARIVGCDRETRVEEIEEEIILTLSNSLKVPQLMDLSMSILMSACRVNYGSELNPTVVKFIHAKPDCGNEYTSYFNAPVEFNAETDSIAFKKSVTDKHLPTGNKYLAEIHDQYVIRYLENIDRNNFIDRVKINIIDLLSSGKISDEDVAYKLNISSRTLQRKLHRHKTSFRSILDEVRQNLATNYIRDPATSLMEIAFILGYSEYTSFSRAYKRWTGSSPGKDRLIEQLELGGNQ